jgi:hypothetical protein
VSLSQRQPQGKPLIVGVWALEPEIASLFYQISKLHSSNFQGDPSVTSALGQKPTYALQQAMSAMGHKQTSDLSFQSVDRLRAGTRLSIRFDREDKPKNSRCMPPLKGRDKNSAQCSMKV